MIHAEIRKYVLRSQAHRDRARVAQITAAARVGGRDTKVSEAAIDRIIGESFSARKLERMGFPSMPKGIRGYVIAQLLKSQEHSRGIALISARGALQGVHSSVLDSQKGQREGITSDVHGWNRASAELDFEARGSAKYCVRDHFSSITHQALQYSAGRCAVTADRFLVSDQANSSVSPNDRLQTRGLFSNPESVIGSLSMNSVDQQDGRKRGTEGAESSRVGLFAVFDSDSAVGRSCALRRESGFGTAPIRHEQSMENGPPE
jgi:hypothetical protein